MTRTDDEIRSQPELWRRVAGGPKLDHVVARGRRMLVVGCGTSAFMAMSFAALREQAGFGETDWAYGSEIPTGRRDDGLVAPSRAGTTAEIVDAPPTPDARSKNPGTARPRGPVGSPVRPA